MADTLLPSSNLDNISLDSIMSASTSSSAIPVDSPGTICTACQVKNGPARKFCHGCGQRLSEPCASCQTANAVDATFCGHCGGRLADVFQALHDDIETKFRRAQDLISEGRFFEAQTLLRAVPASSDSRLQTLLADVRQLTNGMQATREQESAKAESAHQDALSLIQEQRISEAREKMSTIPVGLLSPAMKETITQLDTTWQEIQTLRQQIRAALQAKQTDTLLPQVLRLLHLQPNETALQRLANELTKRSQQQAASTAVRALRDAQTLFQQQKYLVANDRLEDIEEAQLPDEALRQTLRTIREVACALKLLKTEPYTVPELMPIAERWLQLCPHDAQAKKLLQTLQARLKSTLRTAEFGQPWIKAPDDRPAVRATQWLRLPPKSFLPEDTEALLNRPSEFFSAYGLALQGLGVAPVSLDLLPVTKSFIGKWIPTAKASATASDVWGLDVGNSGLKAVHLNRDKKTNAIVTREAIFVAHRQSLSEANDDATTHEILKETLHRWVEQTGKTGAAAVVGFPGTQSLGRWFDLPPLKANKVAEAIGYEARMQIPIPVEEIEYDWHVWPTLTDTTTFQHVTLLAARRDQIVRWLAPFREQGVRLIGLQSGSLAFFNAGEYFRNHALSRPDTTNQAGTKVASENPPLETIGWLDIGADSTTLVVCNGAQLRFRTLGTGIRKIDRALMDQRQLTMAQAEAARRMKLPQDTLHELHPIIDSAVEEILRPIHRSISSFEGEGWKLDRLVVGGGGANQIGILRHLVHPV